MVAELAGDEGGGVRAGEEGGGVRAGEEGWGVRAGMEGAGERPEEGLVPTLTLSDFPPPPRRGD